MQLVARILPFVNLTMRLSRRIRLRTEFGSVLTAQIVERQADLLANSLRRSSLAIFPPPHHLRRRLSHRQLPRSSHLLRPRRRRLVVHRHRHWRTTLHTSDGVKARASMRVHHAGRYTRPETAVPRVLIATHPPTARAIPASFVVQPLNAWGQRHHQPNHPLCSCPRRARHRRLWQPRRPHLCHL